MIKVLRYLGLAITAWDTKHDKDPELKWHTEYESWYSRQKLAIQANNTACRDKYQ